MVHLLTCKYINICPIEIALGKLMIRCMQLSSLRYQIQQTMNDDVLIAVLISIYDRKAYIHEHQ